MLLVEAYCIVQGIRGKEKLPTIFEAAIHPVTLAIMANLGPNKMPGPDAKLLSQVMHWQEGRTQQQTSHLK